MKVNTVGRVFPSLRLVCITLFIKAIIPYPRVIVKRFIVINCNISVMIIIRIQAAQENLNEINDLRARGSAAGPPYGPTAQNPPIYDRRGRPRYTGPVEL